MRFAQGRIKFRKFFLKTERVSRFTINIVLFHLELFFICDNIENHEKVLTGFQRYHLKI